MMAAANLLKSKDEFRRAMIDAAGDQLVVVDFFATWCTPCQHLLPDLLKLEQKFPGVLFYKINVDENVETTEYYSVTVMPTFILFKNGAKVDQLQGVNLDALRELIIKQLPPTDCC